MAFSISRVGRLLFLHAGGDFDYKLPRLQQALQVNFSIKSDAPETESELEKHSAPIGDGKLFKSAEEVVSDIPNRAKLLVGDFGLCGIPENLIEALLNRGSKDLVVVSNNAGVDDFGLGKLLKEHRIRRVIASYVGKNAESKKQYLSLQLEVELMPQGTLVKRVRAGGAGIPAFYTPTGCGTIIEEGNVVIKYDSDGNPDIFGDARPAQQFSGTDYILDSAITGDRSVKGRRGWEFDIQEICEKFHLGT